MKRLLAGILCAALALSFSFGSIGCSGDKKDDKKPDAKKKDDKKADPAKKDDKKPDDKKPEDKPKDDKKAP